MLFHGRVTENPVTKHAAARRRSAKEAALRPASSSSASSTENLSTRNQDGASSGRGCRAIGTLRYSEGSMRAAHEGAEPLGVSDARERALAFGNEINEFLNLINLTPWHKLTCCKTVTKELSNGQCPRRFKSCRSRNKLRATVPERLRGLTRTISLNFLKMFYRCLLIFRISVFFFLKHRDPQIAASRGRALRSGRPAGG